MPHEFKRFHEVLSPAQHHGDIFLFDGFEGAFRWTASGTGTPTVDAHALGAYTGSYGCRILTDATQLTGAYAQALRGIPTPLIPRIEFSCHYAHLGTIPSLYSDFLLEYSDGTNNYLAGIRHIANTGQVQYLDSAGAWQDVTGVICKLQGLVHQEIKLEIDFNADIKVYGKLTFADQEADLSAYPVQTVGASVYKHINITLKATSNLDTTAVRINVDNVMVKRI